MAWIDIFIRRPVLTWMLTLSLVVFGALGFARLGVDQFPKMDLPRVNVSSVLEGASPEVIQHHIGRHPCGDHPCETRFCPCGSVMAVFCPEHEEIVFAAVRPGRGWCEHAVEAIGPIPLVAGGSL